MWEENWGSYSDEPVRQQERVLVVLANNLADWQRVRDEHWYRVPLSRAPERIAAQYLAFYHTRVFGPLRWSIHYYARIERFLVLPRHELLPAETDHPRADELYYKVELGPLRQIPRPIPSRRLRRLTFIMTTLSRLLTAGEINDLWMREGRDQSVRRAYTMRETGPAYLVSAATA